MNAITQVSNSKFIKTVISQYHCTMHPFFCTASFIIWQFPLLPVYQAIYMGKVRNGVHQLAGQSQIQQALWYMYIV